MRSEHIRLNKFLAHAGISSRREADTLIQAGLVKVNGKVVTEMGHKVGPGDEVRYNDAIVRSEKKVYLLLNKPKGFITTTDDPKARKTVMELVSGACKERIYPVGRLDRQTTGVLMFTNDGALADKLLHPSNGAKKIYDVVLSKALAKADLAKIEDGLELEDGPVSVDQIAYVEDKDRKHIGIELHVGRNRIVRRIFEHLGYEVTKLDRVSFSGLTKKRLSRGQWRFLSSKEVDFLRMRS
jgi:23S rRNA pseudouridine2605 synthase